MRKLTNLLNNLKDRYFISIFNTF